MAQYTHSVKKVGTFNLSRPFEIGVSWEALNNLGACLICFSKDFSRANVHSLIYKLDCTKSENFLDNFFQNLCKFSTIGSNSSGLVPEIKPNYKIIITDTGATVIANIVQAYADGTIFIPCPLYIKEQLSCNVKVYICDNPSMSTVIEDDF